MDADHGMYHGLRLIKITNWRDCIRNRPKWKEFVEMAKRN